MYCVPCSQNLAMASVAAWRQTELQWLTCSLQTPKQEQTAPGSSDGGKLSRGSLDKAGRNLASGLKLPSAPLEMWTISSPCAMVVIHLLPADNVTSLHVSLLCCSSVCLFPLFLQHHVLAVAPAVCGLLHLLRYRSFPFDGAAVQTQSIPPTAQVTASQSMSVLVSFHQPCNCLVQLLI